MARIPNEGGGPSFQHGAGGSAPVTNRAPRPQIPLLSQASPLQTTIINSAPGAREVPGGSANHPGIDLRAGVGTQVYSTITGKVAYVGSINGYGNVVDIVSDDGHVRTRVAHLENPLPGITEGTRVTQGQAIALSGNTGHTTGPHVHYEVAVDGVRVDPRNGQTITGLKPMAIPGSGAGSGAGTTGGTPGGSNSPNYPQPDPSKPPLRADDQFHLREDLARGGGYYPNYLNGFFNVAYHIRFFMVDPTVFSQALGDVSTLDDAAIFKAIDGAKKVIIAESGVTAALNITSMSFKCYPSATTILTELLMAINEPVGTSFYEVVRNAAVTLGIADFQNTPYFVELAFKGYDEEGNAIPNVLSNFAPEMDEGGTSPLLKNGGRWIYKINLVDVDTSISEGGSQHTLRFTGGSTQGVRAGGGADGEVIPMAMTVSGDTIGEFLTNLKDTLERQFRFMHGGNDLFHFNFRVAQSNDTQKGVSNDPTTWRLSRIEPQYDDSTTLTISQEQKFTMQINEGVPLDEVLRYLFINTEEGRRLAADMEARGQAADRTVRARAQILMMPTMMVTTGRYDLTYKQYEKTFYWTITPRYHDSAIVDLAHAQTAADPTVQKDMVKKLRELGYFRKRFDYYYTGANTEVMSLDVKFKMLWSVVLPHVVGWGVSQNQHVDQASYNEQLRASQRAAEELRSLIQQSTAANRAYDDAIKQARAAQMTDAEIASNRDIQQLRQRASTADQAATAASVAARDARVRLPNGGTIDHEQDDDAANGDKTIYAEDLTEVPDEIPFGVPISIATANTGSRDGTGTPAPYHRDRSVVGMVMEQLLGDQGAMMQLDFEIRGDPYWIGQSNIRRVDQADTAVAPYTAADVVFLLRVAFPFNVSDEGEDEGSPNVRAFKSDPSSRMDAISGFYRVREIENVFENGVFKQKLTAFRHPTLSVALALGYGSAEAELSPQNLGDSYAAAYGGGFNGQPGMGAGGEGAAAVPAATTAEQNHRMQVIYDTLTNELHWTPEAARTYVAQIGRENGYSDVMFGVHTDHNNGLANVGMMSWQGNRASGLMNYMRSQGLLNSDGSIVKNDEAIRAMARYSDIEIKTTPGYAPTNRAVHQGGLRYDSIEPTMSTNYVGWDRAGNKINSQEHLRKMRSYYSRAGQLGN
jgi:hypothetical protein